MRVARLPDGRAAISFRERPVSPVLALPRLRRINDALSNRVGAFTVTLPVGERDPRRRLAHFASPPAANTDRRAASDPPVTRALALLPGFAYRLLAQTVTGRVSLIGTNMPGPSEQRVLAGALVEVIPPFAPVATPGATHRRAARDRPHPRWSYGGWPSGPGLACRPTPENSHKERTGQRAQSRT